MVWATDSNYLCAGGEDKRRRDILFLKGSERVGETTTRNALCCEAVLFLKVSNLGFADFLVPRTVLEDVDERGSITFVIGRWFTLHDTVVERDSCYRPICPGPLCINHCLWKYASADSDRTALVTSRGQPTALFTRQYNLFGQTMQDAQRTLQQEKRAYFGLLSPTNVVSVVTMCSVFVPNTSTPDPHTWLQSLSYRSLTYF